MWCAVARQGPRWLSTRRATWLPTTLGRPAATRSAQVAAIIEHELSPVQRSIVRMREYEGLDFDDIARRLDLQPSNVRVQLSRARKRIRQIYRERHQQ